jgi:hypothetical protein
MKTNNPFLCFFLFSALSIAQTIHTVDNRMGSTAQFTDLQAAMDAAMDGDFIYIHPSPTSYNNAVIRKELHLRGLGHYPELNGGENAKINVLALSSITIDGTIANNSTISGLEINYITSAATIPVNNIGIINCKITTEISLSPAIDIIIQGNIFSNARIVFGPGQSNNIIANNIFDGNLSNTIIDNVDSSNSFHNNVIILKDITNNTVFRNSDVLNVQNCMFLYTPTSTSINVDSVNSTINFENCLTYAYGGQTLNELSGTGNFNNINPQLEDLGNPENPFFSYSKDYHITSGSPAENAGIDSTDLGIYGGNYPFIQRGYSFDLPYPTEVNILNAMVQAGNILEVQLKANGN